MDIRVAISRSAAYGFVGALIIASFASLLLFPLSAPLAILIGGILALFWAWAAHRLREFIQTPLEEKWITGWYSSDKLINNIAKKLVPVVEKEEAFKVIADELKDIIKIKEIQVLRDGEAAQMANLRDVAAMPGKHGYHLPLFSSEKLEAVLAIGPKISEDPYSERDITLFRTIMIQAMSILDRIRPYEKIKKEFEANQKKLYEAEIQLQRSQRLASLGTLTAGITHEIRNPLSVIRTETERLADENRDLNYLKEHRTLMAGQIKRIDNIINRTLGLAKEKKTERKAVNLNDVINSVLGTLARPAAVALEKELNELLPIQGNFEELEEVFENLVQNAIQAMPGGGVLRLRTRLEADQIVIDITDSGCGIPAEIQEKVFEPFFSTRHEGVGLGLSIVYQILQSHGATIQFQCRQGQGTTFSLRFPLPA